MQRGAFKAPLVSPELGNEQAVPASVGAELPPRAPRAAESELLRLVIGEIRAPPILVRRQPHLAALGALRDQDDALGAHGRSLGEQLRSLLGVRLGRPALLADTAPPGADAGTRQLGTADAAGTRKFIVPHRRRELAATAGAVADVRHLRVPETRSAVITLRFCTRG